MILLSQSPEWLGWQACTGDMKPWLVTWSPHFLCLPCNTRQVRFYLTRTWLFNLWQWRWRFLLVRLEQRSALHCREVGTVGVYKWQFSRFQPNQLITQPRKSVLSPWNVGKGSEESDVHIKPVYSAAIAGKYEQVIKGEKKLGATLQPWRIYDKFNLLYSFIDKKFQKSGFKWKWTDCEHELLKGSLL